MSKYKLVIVESPAKAKTIEKYLGSDYKVIASKGHIMDLPKKKLGVNLDTFETDIEPLADKEQTIKEIITMAKNASDVYLASDADREGESIAFHIQKLIKRKDAKRVLINSITKKEILDAIGKAGELDELKYEAQQTRRILDRLIGYKISPILWDKLQSGLSAGRVQSVALKIIVLREEEIENFVPEKWFDVVAYLEKDNIKFESKFFGYSKDTNSKIKEKEKVDEILNKIDSQLFVTIDKIIKEKLSHAPPPYTTSKLQQEAASKLGFGTKDTMRIAQKLYEGVEIKNVGRTGLITYMRTDSVRSEPDSIQKAREIIKNKIGEQYLSPEIIIHKQKKNDSKIQDAHEAIRPTQFDLDPDKIRDSLSSEEYDLYKLIWNKFIASQMAPSITENTTIFFECNGLFFKSSGNVVLFDGYTKVSKDIKDKDEETGSKIPRIEINDKIIQHKKANIIEKSTTPPPRYNEGTLVKEMEDKGIGRPATYAAIIDNILGRGYISKTKEKDTRLFPTELGRKLCKMLNDNFPVQMDLKFTSKTEKNLDDIEEGQVKYTEVLKNFWQELSKEIEKVNKAMPSIEKTIDPNWMNKYKTDISCDVCEKGLMVIKKGSKGVFLSCSEYPNCKNTHSFEKINGKIKILKPTKKYSEEKCKLCSKRMVVIKNDKGNFLSCEDYPNCKSTAPIPSKIECPKCKKGKLLERKSKNGKFFHGCNQFPQCDFVFWDEVIQKKCKNSECKSNFIVKSKDMKKTCYICKTEQN